MYEPEGRPSHGPSSNGVKSADTIPASLDKALDKSVPDTGPGAISIRNGPMTEVTPMDLDRRLANKPHTNGASAKRKSRPSAVKSYRDASSSDEAPTSKRRKTKAKADLDDNHSSPVQTTSLVKKPPKVTAAQLGESEDDDVPITKKLAKQKKQLEDKASETADKIQAADTKKSIKKDAASSSAAKKKPPLKPKGKASASDTKPSKKDKATTTATKDSDADAEADEDDDEQPPWWETKAKGDGSIKWTTLEHNGVVFPPAYEPLPKNVKLIYDKVPVSLEPDAEEIATFYGAMLNSTVNVTNPVFNANFFSDFTKVLNKNGHGKDANGNKVKIASFEKCDFSKIFEHFDTRKKALTLADRKAIKAAKDKAEEPFLYCKWDGRKEKVGNFRVEPPGLFRGRGEHPKTGRVKTRVMPEQITINIGKGATPPTPPNGHKWKEVKHDQTGTWLASWQENIKGDYKYVMLAANSAIKGKSDLQKFEKARELKKHIAKIRRDYTKDLKSNVTLERQRATAMYFIDKLALRAGNEKGDDEAETVGCCSLKYEHVTLKPPNIVVFDFLGKDSIRFHDEVEVEAQIFKNMRIFRKEPKGKGDDIFDHLSTTLLNKHLQNYMPGLTAKVFRTYNASWTMANLLKEAEYDPKSTVLERIKIFNDANRRVAVLCNHKRTVASSHENTMERFNLMIGLSRYQYWRNRNMMLDIDPKLKKKHGADYFARHPDLTGEFVEAVQTYDLAERRKKIETKFKKENDKLQEEGKKPQADKELKERLKEVDELERAYKKENKSGKVPVADGKTIEKLERENKTLESKIEKNEATANDKEENKEIALGTSKTNYIDPRLITVFHKKFKVPIERLFSKTLREKFEWAIKSVDEKWDF